MKRNSNLKKSGVAALIISFIVSCTDTGGNFFSSSNNFKVSLTDAPNFQLSEVNVNIHHIELFLRNGSTEKRLIIGQNLGMVDLLKLQNGVMLPITEFHMPVGVEVSQIRLVLNADNNHAIKSDGTRCDMQTPSGQQSGVKILIKNPFSVEDGFRYSMVVDFDANKSVVVRGNGTCLLKPVILLKDVTKEGFIVDGQNDSTDNTSVDPVSIVDGTDSNIDPENTINPILLGEDGSLLSADQLGFDVSDPSTYPDGITVDDLIMYF